MPHKHAPSQRQLLDGLSGCADRLLMHPVVAGLRLCLARRANGTCPIAREQSSAALQPRCTERAAAAATVVHVCLSPGNCTSNDGT